MARQFEDFARTHGITSSFEDADMNPAMADDKWARTASHYTVTVKRGKKSMTFRYSKGSALEYGVTTAEALEAIYSDAGSVAGYSVDYTWQEWARDLGYEWEPECESISARKAEEYGIDCAGYQKAHGAWKACRKMETEARRLLGTEGFDELLTLEAP